MRTIATTAALLLCAAGQAQTVDICDRTPQVRDAIILEVLDADDCAAVDSESLASVETLNMASGERGGRVWYLTALRAADFDGLTGLTTLRLNYNRLTTLPAGVFDELTSLLDLDLRGNRLTQGGFSLSGPCMMGALAGPRT